MYLYYNVKLKLFWLFVDFLKFWHINFWNLKNFQLITILFIYLFWLNLIPIFKPNICCYLLIRKPDITQEHMKLESMKPKAIAYAFLKPNAFSIYKLQPQAAAFLFLFFLSNPTCSTSFSNLIKSKDTMYNQINDETSIGRHSKDIPNGICVLFSKKWNLCLFQKKERKKEVECVCLRTIYIYIYI